MKAFERDFGSIGAHIYCISRLFDASDDGVEAMRAFNEIMAREAALQSIIVPIGDGLWVGLKI